MTDPATEFRAMYLAHCAGVAVPSPEEWVALFDERLRDTAADRVEGWHQTIKAGDRLA